MIEGTKDQNIPRWARRVRFALAVIGFSWALLAGALLHLNLPAARSAAASLTESWMTSVFRGSAEIDSISRLEAAGLTAHDIVVSDPQGRPVLGVGQLVVNVSLLGILERVFGGHEKISIQIDDVVVSDAEVFLHDTEEVDETGERLEYPSIADAFTPAQPTPDREEGGKPVRVWLPDVKLRGVYARGTVAGSPTLEMRVEEAAAQVLATEKGAAVDIPTFDIEASGVGGVDTRVQGTVHVRAPGAVYGQIDGYIGRIPLEQRFRFESDNVQIHGSLPELRPEAVRPLYPEWPIDQTVSVENHIEGIPPRFEVTGIVRAGEGVARVDGVVLTAPGLEADLDVDAEGLDLSQVDSSLPPSDLHLRSAAEIWQTPDGPHLELNATLLPSELDGTPLPVVDFRINTDERGVVGEATLHERGLPAHVELTRAPDGPTEFQLSLRRTRLQDSPRLTQYLNARGTVEGDVDGKLDGDQLSLALNLQGSRMGYDDVSLGHMHLTGTASTDVDAVAGAQMDLELSASDAQLGPARLEKLQARVEGPVLQPQFEVSGTTRRGVDLSARGSMRTDQVHFTQITGKIEPEGRPVDLKASEIAYDQGRFVMRDFDLRSEGSIHADLEIQDRQGRAEVRAENLNLSRILESLDADTAGLGGRIDADVDVTVGEHSQGTISLDVRNGRYEGFSDFDLSTDVTLDGHRSEGTFSTEFEELGQVSGTWDVTAQGPIFSPDSYPDATGKVEAAVEGIDLQTVGLLLRTQSDIVPTGGTARAELTVQRESAAEFPRIEASVKTHRLTLELERAGETEHIEDLDIEINGAADGTSNQVQVAARLIDPLGDVVSTSGTVRLPLTYWIDEPPELAEAVAIVRQSPLELVVAIPERRLVDFPELVPLPKAEGRLSGRGVVRGTFDQPNLDLAVAANDVGGPGTGLSQPVDAEATLRYRKASGELWGDLKANQGARRIGAASFDVVLPFSHLMGARDDGKPLWTGDLQVVLDAAPLELLQTLDENELRGDAQGSISISRRQIAPQLVADLRLRHLEVGERYLGEGTIEATADGRRLLARARFHDEFGTLQTTAEFGLESAPWGARVAPEEPIYLSLASDSYDAAVLTPFVSDVFSEFSGSLNGQLRMEIVPPKEENAKWETSLSGDMSLTGGVMVPRPMGLRLEGTDFDISAAQEGDYNVVRLTNLRARAQSEAYNLKGNAIAYFKNLEFEKSRFNLTFDQLPILNEGTKLADVTGKASGELALRQEELQLDLELPELTAVLPPAPKDLIELSDNPTIDILQPIAPEPEEETEDEGLPVRVLVRLGEDVRVQNRLLDVGMVGEPELYFGEEFFVAGRLELTQGGRVQVLRRDFVIEYGTLLFDNPDPGNPHLDVAASWRAANGTRVRATVSGTANDPVIEWSSEPPLPEAEIVALLVGGGGGTGDQAGGEGAGISYAAAAVNEVLGQSGLDIVEVRASTDTGAGEGRMARLSERRWESYTAAFQVSDKLWFEGSYQRGTPGPISEPQSGFSGTLDWRFKPNWSARTEVGTLGVGLDLLWQYRY